MAVTVIAVSPAASASADLGDVLGGLLGGGSTPPEPAPPPSPQPAPSQSGSSGSAGPTSLAASAGTPKDPLLAPESICPGQSDPSLPAHVEDRVMVCMLSFARVASGLPALRLYKPLQVSATDKAQDVRRCQRLSHEACGRSPWYWFKRVGFFRGRYVAGEMLAFGGAKSGTAQRTMTNWLNSKEHRAVLLHSGFDLVGVGTVTGTFSGYRGMRIWVAHLGARR
jgi:uncharacterized protein YkwD